MQQNIFTVEHLRHELRGYGICFADFINEVNQLAGTSINAKQALKECSSSESVPQRLKALFRMWQEYKIACNQNRRARKAIDGLEQKIEDLGVA